MPPKLKKKSKSTAAKVVACTHCGKPTEVGARAMSVACPHCNKRLILEDYKITGYYGVREFATCGDIVIEKSGNVAASIKAGNLTVMGIVKGNVTARGSVTIRKSATYKGDISAPVLHIDGGAQLDGFLRIGETEPTE